jgi:hypothetical protein
MLQGLPFPNHIINYYWGFLGATYIVAQIVTFVECHPFNLYWQVVPDPGMPRLLRDMRVNSNMNDRHMPPSTHTINHLCCSQHCHRYGTHHYAYAMVIQNEAVTQTVRSPRSEICAIYLSPFRRISLIGLFSIGFLLIAIAIVRLPIYGNGTSQVNRNTWGSVEAFAAAFVANVPTLFALRNKTESRDPTTMSQTHRNSDIIGFRQVKDSGITVTNSIELRNDAIEDVKRSHEHREFWDTRQASNDSLVPSVHVSFENLGPITTYISNTVS